MKIQLKSPDGEMLEYESGSLTWNQCVTLRGLTLESWITGWCTHRDRILKSGVRSTWHVCATTEDGGLVAFAIEPDGRLRRSQNQATYQPSHN
jgi:hypothetical protein